ncbi:MAG: tetratricopeptide repeat protein [bacterium]
MSSSQNVQELLEKGLYHYGLGEVDKALSFWREVLALDPDNETAQEYIEIETGREQEPSPSPSPAPEPWSEVAESSEGPSISVPDSFLEGQRHLQSYEWEKAMNDFLEAHKSRPSQLYYWTHVPLARAGLIKDVMARLGGDNKYLKLKESLTELSRRKRFNQEEGFVLSLISGEMTLEDIVSLSPIPRFQTFHILYRLLEEGLIAVSEG